MHLDTCLLFYEVFYEDEISISLFIHLSESDFLETMQKALAILIKHQNTWDNEDNTYEIIELLLPICQKLEIYNEYAERVQIGDIF